MKKALFCVAIFLTLAARAVTTGIVPAEGVFRFTFGTDSAVDGFAVPASAVYDANHQYGNTTGETFTYGFLGTTAESYKTDVPWSLPSVAYAIDGFKVVQGQSILLHGVPGKGVTGPSAAEYLPAGASPYEGRYPIRFAMSAEPNAYYAVTCTVVNVSSTANADVTLFSERCHIQAHHLTLAPDETRTFAWSVELAPNVFKSSGTYVDDAINVVVVGENAGLHSLVVIKQPQVAGSVRGAATDKMNVGKTMWLCDDSTGTDQRNDTPYFSLQNYSGVGSGLSRYAPANLAIRNQGEGGLATSAGSHRRSCLLKEGDYLYVEYGHNEGSVESFTNNLELYLADANTAKANLIIVSPVERRSSWNKETETWNRSLEKITLGGEAWVEDKIAQGVTNVAFLDLNKRYTDWMNAESRRIHALNPAIPLNAAISFYYRSAKGAHVDNTHINNAGTDQAAYWVWYDALARVAAGGRADATASERVQATVLKGITDGYQGTVGLESAEANLPWLVSDEIIAAGLAPNAFWDAPVTSGYDYVNEAVVAGIDAEPQADGSLMLRGVTMRILNPGNYYKAVVEVVNADGSETNRYYSYYNYDVGGAGKLSGDLVVPEQAGFLTADRDKAEVSAPECATITVPVGATASVWIAVADAGTWQVGAATPCSEKYPIAWWSSVVVNEDCASADDWKVLTQAVYTTNVVDGTLSFSSTGANAANTKKNFGLYRELDGAIASGRYRISFKALIEAGEISFRLGDQINSTTTLFQNDIRLLTLTTAGVTGYRDLVPLVTVAEGTDGERVPQAQVNTARWIDVDLIVDRDNGRASYSVGGSAYVTWEDAEVIPGAFAGRTWKYFGITTPGQTSTYGAIDDLKVLKLAPGEVVSEKYEVEQWNLAEVGTSGNPSLVGGEVTANGYVWQNAANKGTGSTLSSNRFMTFTPAKDGRLTVRFSVDAVVANRTPTLIVNAGETTACCVNDATKLASAGASVAATEYTLSIDLTAGMTYYIWPYSYNWSGAGFKHAYTITSIAYTTEKTNERVFAVAEGVTETCAEVLADRLELVKTGAGTLNLVGNNSFIGDVRVTAGVLRLDGPYAAAGTVIAQYEGRELATNQFVTAAAVTRPLHTFMVWNPSGVEGDYYTAMFDYNNSLWCVRKRGQNDGYWQVRNYNKWTRQVAVNGSGDAAKSGLQLLEVTTGDWVRNATGRLSFGSGKENTLHEIVLYSTALSSDQQAQMESYLMAKWGIGTTTYTQLPPDASVEVAADATLDLGSARPVVSRVMLAEGSVLAVDAVQSGEKLLTAQTIENAGAILKVGGKVSSRFVLSAVDNPDGTQSLVAQRMGLIIFFQ